MNNLGWFPRRSSSLAKGGRGSFQDGKGPMGHGSRSEDRYSKIPVRSSSQSSACGSEIPSLIRSKSTLDMASTPLCTPQSQCLFTPKLYSGHSNKKPGKDHRNLQDKDFQREASSLVLGYFQANCPIALKGSDIRPMTIKMFIEMVNHLFERLGIYNRDSLVQFTTANYEKELPVWMKYLDYPGSVTRGWIQTVNVPQYWPHVLGLLSWLVALVSACEKHNVEEQIDIIATSDLNKYISIEYFFACVKVHNLLSAGKVDAVSDECRRIIQVIEEAMCCTDEQMEKLQAENSRLRSLTNDPELQGQKDALDELEQRLVVAKSQSIKAAEGVSIKKENIAAVEREAAKKEGNINALKHASEKCRQEVERLKLKVDNQAMSIGQFSKLQKQCEFILKEINFTQKECEDNDKLACRYEQDIASKRDKIMQNAHAFNRSIIQLAQHIPELTGLRARGDPECANAVEDVEKLVVALKDMKTRFQADLTDVDNLRQERAETADQLKCQLKEALETEQKIRATIDESKAEILRLQDALTEQEESLKADIKSLETKKLEEEQKLKESEELKVVKATMEHRDSMLNKAKTLMEDKERELWCALVQKMKQVATEMETFEKNCKLVVERDSSISEKI